MTQPRPGRNAPCPCGSGKKYKHCCLAKDEQAARQAEPELLPDTVPEVEGERDVWTGLAAADLRAIFADPFGVPERIAFPEVLPHDPVAPVAIAFEALWRVMDAKRATVDASGMLRRAALRAVAGVIDALEREAGATPIDDVERRSLDIDSLALLVVVAGLVEARGGRLMPTGEGRALYAEHGLAGVYPALLRGFVTAYPWSAEDDLPELDVVQQAWPLVPLMLRRFGDRPVVAEAFEDAFVDLFGHADEIADLADDPLVEDDEEAADLVLDAFTTRSLLRFAEFFGLASVHDAEYERDDPEAEEAGDAADDDGGGVWVVRSLPLLGEVMRLHVTQDGAETLVASGGADYEVRLTDDPAS
jgi:hypothetical protein